MRQDAARVSAAAVEAQEQTTTSGAPFEIEFDNSTDRDSTVIRLTGQTRSDLLHILTGAFSSQGLSITSAVIRSSRQGVVQDIFKVTTADGDKIKEDQFEAVKEGLLAACAASSQSSLPAIYGQAAEVKARLRPLTSGGIEAESSGLERAATEMAQAATALVTLERKIIELAGKGAEARTLEELETERSEAAAVLERRMAAMEAALAARRSPREAAQPAAARGPGAELRFQAGGATSSGPAAGLGYEIILQAFNWESHRESWYQVLKSKAGQIAAAGYTSLWLPPPSDSVSQQGYLPRDLYNLNSQYGSEGDLRDCISVLHENDLKVIADIVINHRCAHNQDDQGRWNKFGGRLPWATDAICCNNPTFGGKGNHKTGEDYVAAPNIDHTNARVREDIKAWMKWLRSSIGFDGWRFDFVKGYSGDFVKEYLDATVPEMAFGEYWDTCEYTDGVLNYNQDAHRQRITNWCDRTGGTAAAFDFTTKGILQEAMGRREYWRLVDNQGRPPGLMGMWPSRAVTFLENHDTGSTLNHWPFPWRHLHEGYAYLLTHPGTPCVFWDHWVAGDGLGDNINKLLKLRQHHGLSARSKVVVHKAISDVYAATVDNKVAVKVGPGDWSPASTDLQIGQRDWVLNCSGPSFAVWDAIF